MFLLESWRCSNVHLCFRFWVPNSLPGFINQCYTVVYNHLVTWNPTSYWLTRSHILYIILDGMSNHLPDLLHVTLWLQITGIHSKFVNVYYFFPSGNISALSQVIMIEQFFQSIGQGNKLFPFVIVMKHFITHLFFY